MGAEQAPPPLRPSASLSRHFKGRGGGRGGPAGRRREGGFTAPDGTSLPKSPRLVFLHLEEESYLARYEKIRGFGYNLTETLYVISNDVLDMAVRRRRLFPGTNRSNVMGPIACPAFTSEHHHLLPWKLKRDVFSQAAKVACRVGGAGPEGAEKNGARQHHRGAAYVPWLHPHCVG